MVMGLRSKQDVVHPYLVAPTKGAKTTMKAQRHVGSYSYEYVKM